MSRQRTRFPLAGAAGPRPACLVALLATLATGTATAAETGSSWDAGVRAGTLGVGLEMRRALTNRVALRLGAGWFDYGTEIDASGIDYDVDFTVGGLTAGLDWHPFANGVHLSAGALLNLFEIEGTARPTGGTFDFDGTAYPVEDVGSVRATASFDDVAPYLGVGYAHAPRGSRGWTFAVGAGVAFAGSPRFTLDVACAADLPTAACDQLQEDAAAEARAAEADVDDYELFPILTIGLSRRF